jgi:hypothetical protein
LLVPGESILLRLASMESISGTVRWTLKEIAGIEFDRAIHPAVVEYLCRLHPGECEHSPRQQLVASRTRPMKSNQISSI